MDALLFEDIDDLSGLKKEGKQRIEWARSHMPVLQTMGREIAEKESLKERSISMALHTEAKTAVLALTLAEAGANVRLVSCNPLSTDDRVAAALMDSDVKVRARHGESREDYYRALNWALDMEPEVLIDDGGDLLKLVHTQRRELLEKVRGGCEETTTGIIRLKAMEEQGKLKVPMINVNDCAMKHLFDNRYGTGQSTIDGVLNATNLTIAGSRVTVAGYGWCGRGIAMRMRGMGAIVSVTEVDPVRAVEALHDGFDVQKMEDLAPDADMIITATGCKNAVSRFIISQLKDGCVLANSGHFDNEIDTSYLNSHRKTKAREHVDRYDIEGRKVYLLSQGRLVNLASGQGHPVEIMDMSFAVQAAGAEMIIEGGLSSGVIPIPQDIENRIARIKLRSMNAAVDHLTEDQVSYLSSWEEGT